MEYVDTTQGISAVPNKQFSVPVQGKDNKTYYAQPRLDAIPVDGGTELIDNPAPWTPTKGNAQQQPTPAQEKATEFLQQNQKVAETQGVGTAWYNQAIDPASPKLKQLSQTHTPVDLEGGDILGFGTMYFPIEEDKEITITGRGQDFNFSQTRNRRDPKLIEERRKFYDNMDTALAKVNGSWEVQTLLDQYGSVSNFPKNKNETTGLVFPLKEKKDGKSSITFKKGTGLIEAWTALQSAPGMGRKLGILIARSGEMPPVGQDRKAMAAKFLSE